MPQICLGEDGFVVENGAMRYRKDEILEFAKNHSFKGIELHSNFEAYVLGTERLLKNHYEKFGLQVPGLQTAHITSLYSPISDDADEREQYVKSMAEAIRFAAALDAKHSTLTPPTFTPNYTSDEYASIVDRYTSTISDVVSVAEKLGVVMAIEPEPDLILNGGTFGDSIDDVTQVLDAVASKNLNVLYDIAHVNIISHGDPIGFLQKLKGRISWVHVADNDLSFTPEGTAKHLEFGAGNVNMVQVMKALKEVVPKLEWLQIDTWANPYPYHVAARNERSLERILKEISWASS